MKIFSDVSSLAAATLTADQIVKVKSVGDYRIQDSGTGIALANGKIAVPQASGTAISVKQFGAVGDGVTDNTAAYTAMIAALDEGTTIVFPKGTYKGDFISDKAFKLVGNGSTIIPVSNFATFEFQGSLGSYSALGASPSYGDVSLTGVSGLSDDTLVQLYSGNERPSDSQDVNFEVVKIKSTGALFDKVYSDQDGGTPTYAVITPLSGIEIDGFHFEQGVTTYAGIYIRYAEDVIVRNISMNGGGNTTVTTRSCYRVKIDNVKRIQPSAVGSGQGYNVACNTCKYVEVSDIYGEGCRHDYDQDSTYVANIQRVVSTDAQSASIDIAHNGYGSHITVRDCTIRCDSYAVYTSAQGAASPASLMSRDIRIDNIHVTTTKGLSAYDFFVAIYFSTPTRNYEIRNITIHNTNDLDDFDYAGGTYNTGYFPVRVYQSQGVALVENIDSGAASAVLREDVGCATDGDCGQITIRNINVRRFQYVIHAVAPSQYNSYILDGLRFYDSSSVYGAAIFKQSNSTRMRELLIRGMDKVSSFTAITDYGSAGAPTNSYIDIGGFVKRLSSVNGIASGGSFTQEEVLTRGDYAIWGSTSKTLDTTAPFPAPMSTGNNFGIYNYSGSAVLTIPANSNTVDNTSDITIAAGEHAFFQANGDGTKWKLFRVLSSGTTSLST